MAASVHGQARHAGVLLAGAQGSFVRAGAELFERWARPAELEQGGGSAG